VSLSQFIGRIAVPSTAISAHTTPRQLDQENAL